MSIAFAFAFASAFAFAEFVVQCCRDKYDYDKQEGDPGLRIVRAARAYMGAWDYSILEEVIS